MKIMVGRESLLCRIWLLLFCASCTTIQTLTSSVPPSMHGQYARRLDKSDIAKTAMGKAWLEAADPATHDSLVVTLPFQETGFFSSAEPQARFYRFDAKKGQVLTLTSLVKADGPVSIFADVFRKEAAEWRLMVSADSSRRLAFEFESDESCLVRLQPELLVNAYYSITLSVTPVLLNPVKGATNKSIGSFYGDSRDGGKRKHEGIDIFAPKGTPVVAPTAGVITRVATGGLGGKVIWMNDTRRRHSYYFAHLDSQYVRSGVRVKQGDTLGTVGNTGNARYTPSHLHFGVYQRSSVDPIAYIRTMERLVNELAPDTLFQPLPMKIVSRSARLFNGPFPKAAATSLARDTYVKVIAQSKDYFRVQTADAREGFVERKSVNELQKGKAVNVTEGWLLTAADSSATPVRTLSSQQVESLARHEDFVYVRTDDGTYGWVHLP